MKKYKKYKRQYYLPPEKSIFWAEKEYIEKAPIWCSVDLRDGNQALVVPMTCSEKLKLWKPLINIGFKEIEVGFPAASETEFEFCRLLIEKKLIPSDVTIQVLTQARCPIIKRTFEAIKDAENVIIHIYNSTSKVQRENVFKLSRKEIISLAVLAAKTAVELANEYKNNNPKQNIRFEYSPESFSATELDYALEICNAVLEEFNPTPENKVIINLPSTVELSLPHIFASQVEYISRNLCNRENVILSVHTHNDRGSAVAAAELALLAGAERIEGTLFGNGERTGNCDIVTLAMNMYMQGVDPKLDFSDMPSIVEIYEKISDMKVSPRHPYAGELVYAAFSGSHQDAIAKSLSLRNSSDEIWNIPYLPIDPADVNRVIDTDVIRINSQSGKGGVGYILEKNFGLRLPKKFKEAVGNIITKYADKNNILLSPEFVYSQYCCNFLNLKAPLEFLEAKYSYSDKIKANCILRINNKEIHSIGEGFGKLSAVTEALKEALLLQFEITDYSEHTLSKGRNAAAAAYIEITLPNGKKFYGAGQDTDIGTAAIYAVVSGVCNCMK